ncbi:MAG: flagellar basal body P-ring protein FlgI [Pseudomonadota bacterium]
MRKLLLFLFCCAATVLVLITHSAAGVRIKDIVDIQGARENQLLGYGIVVGLNATGDSLRNSPFTEASIKSMLDQLGIGRTSDEFRTRNVAAVLVTAKLPSFANKGTRIDVNVSSLGDASSLRGGTLVFTALYGGDGTIYASAQGAVVVSGFSAEGDAAEADNNTPTSARIPNGGIVETAAPGNINDEDFLILQLANPDFNTAISIVDRINQHTMSQYKRKLAREVDNRSIVVDIPPNVSTTRFYASFSKLTIEPDTPARIIVDERTGTVIIGSEVKISRVAITHGGLTVSVSEFPTVSQPLPFSDGVTAVVPDTQIIVSEEESSIGIVEGPDLNQLIKGLNMMGAKPSSIIAILQGIKSAGALQAELVVQ